MEIPTKEGMLYLQSVKFGKKSWRRIWTLLFTPSLYGVGRLELYNMRDGVIGGAAAALVKPKLKGMDKRVIRLDDCLSIRSIPEEVCPHDCSAFAVSTTQRTYTLAAPPADDWLPIICQLAFQKNNKKLKEESTGQSEVVPMVVNQLYSSWSTGEYHVVVQRTEAAVRCHLTGSYLLSPTTEALTLRDPQTASPLYHWPYQLLRRFGINKDTVSIEAGRRCDSGEGHFTFLSRDAAKIYRAIEEGIRHHSITYPKSSTRTAPVDVPTSRSNATLDTSYPLYHNMNEWMEEGGYEPEEEDACQDVRAKPVSSNPECIYSLVKFDKARAQPTSEGSNTLNSSSDMSASKIPVNFRQQLSNLLSKEAAKMQPIQPLYQEH